MVGTSGAASELATLMRPYPRPFIGLSLENPLRNRVRDIDVGWS